MAWIERFHCEVCGKEKGDAEDWWLAWSEESGSAKANAQPVLKVTRWDTVLSHGAGVLHLCGQRCAQTQLDRWMTEQRERPAAVETGKPFGI